MKIHGKGPGPTTPVERVTAPQPRDGAGASRGAPVEDQRTDRVELSPAARAAAGEVAAGESAQVLPVPADQPDRLEQVRARVLAGYYQANDVQLAVARQVVASGDHRA